MCIAVPMKVIELNDNQAVCEYNGIRRVVRIDLVKNLKIGDYVIIHTGFAIQKLDVEDALETLKIYEELNNVY